MDPQKLDSIKINEAQLILAEKRTSLAVLRTGLAVLALPLSVISVLIVTSNYYDVLEVMYFLIPLGIVNSVLAIFGVYLIIISIKRMRHFDRMISEIKTKNSVIGEFME
ncbi:MAG: hypothetical protein ACQEQS_03905 [Thermodesulfobacteriota bacterium]